MDFAEREVPSAGASAGAPSADTSPAAAAAAAPSPPDPGAPQFEVTATLSVSGRTLVGSGTGAATKAAKQARLCLLPPHLPALRLAAMRRFA